MMSVAEAPVGVQEAPRSRARSKSVSDHGFMPRLAPPLPRRSEIAVLRKAAKLAGKKLYPWQDIAGQYMTATKAGRWLYPELVLAVARQNGKTSLLVPRIVMGLLRGERIMHTAQDRSLPRDVFVEVADLMATQFAHDLKSNPRLANGTEQVRMLNGGLYRIVAPSRGGARGPSNDLVIVDEAREMTDHDFVGAAAPTLTVSKTPQMVYLSNAGTEDSVVLNALKKRAETDMSLGYLEWSAHPDRLIDDRDGWYEANPSLTGGMNAKGHLDFLERMYQAYVDGGTPEIFETEHLCRWVTTEAPRVVSEVAWTRARGGLSEPKRPVLGIAQDPAGRRASAVIAWRGENTVEVDVLADVDGYPVDLEALAEQVTLAMRKLGVRQVAFDPWTDRDFARFFKDSQAVAAADYEAACERFARVVESGQLRYSDDDGILSGDMAFTVRRPTSHGWVAVRASDDRATTASFAAIRAVWLATNPAARAPQVY